MRLPTPSRFLFLALLVALPWPAFAAPPIFVGNGTPASCTETALVNALLDAQAIGGATIRFRCGRTPAIIEVTGSLLPGDNTTIDGEQKITLVAAPASVEVVVDPGISVTLRRLALSGIGVANHGSLTIVDTVIDNAFGICGGAITNSGTLTVRHSTFTNNDAFIDGGAICNLGDATIESSTFSDNSGGGAANGGGAIWNIGIMSVAGSVLTHNTGFQDPGGAIYNGGILMVDSTVFFQNDAGGGGAIFNDGISPFNTADDAGTLTVRNSVILENTAVGGLFGGNISHGGGIFNRGGTFSAMNVVISNNSSPLEGGGIYTCCGGTTELKNAVVVGNTPNNVATVP